MNRIRTAACLSLVLLSSAALAQPTSKKTPPQRPAASTRLAPADPSAKPVVSLPAADVQHPITVVVQPPPAVADAAERATREREVRAQEKTANVTVGLAILAFLTGGVVCWQAWETRKSVNVAKESIQHSERIDKILHKQWLNVAGWSCDVLAASENGTVTARIMRVGCVVENGTSLPVTVSTIECFVSNANKGRTTFFNGNPLGPGSQYRVETTTLMDAEQTAAYLGDGLGLSIIGRVNYIDVFDERKSQLFGYFCRLQLRGDTVFRPFNISLQTAWEQCEQAEREQKEAIAATQDRPTATRT